jgi:hypothetical protein
MRPLLSCLLLGCAHPTAPADPSPDPIAQLRADVELLASDAYGGRGTLEPGGAKAAEFLAARLQELGLQPAPGQADLRVPYTLYGRGADPERTRITSADGTVELRLEEGVRPFGFSDQGVLTADLVFAGYGISSPEHGWDDYARLDVRGKLVLVLRHEPNEDDPKSLFAGTEATDHSLFTAKARQAAERGAAGILIVTDPLHHTPNEDLRSEPGYSLEPTAPPDPTEPDEQATSLLAAHVSQAGAEALLQRGGHSLIALQRAVDAGHSPASLAVDVPKVTVRIGFLETGSSWTDHNVVGVLPGLDPNAWVVIGAHYDHLGTYAGQGDTTYNGADDNASGTAGVLALARALASREQPFERTVAFAFFSGEEHGLLGSEALVRDGVIPADKTVFMLNLDMIGRNDNRQVHAIGDGYVAGLVEALTEANATYGVPLKPAGTEYAGNTDYHTFFKRDVPFLGLFTGVHEDYHQPSDEPHKLDYDQMHRIVLVARHLIERVADGELTPSFLHHVDWLGVVVRVVDGEARVTEVEPDSRAAAAGIAAGDVVTFEADPPPSPQQVGQRLSAIEPGAEVNLRVRRDAATGSSTTWVTVTRAHPGYLGVIADAVPDDLRSTASLPHVGGVLLSRILPGGPAEAAGLLPGDVLIHLGGYPVTHEDLGRRLTRIGAGEHVTAVIVRGGASMMVELVLVERPGN